MKLNIQLFAGSCSIGTITETTDINTNQSTFTIPATLTTSGATFNNDDAYMTLQWKYASASSWTTISKKTFGIGQNTSKTKSWSLSLTHNDDGTLENVNFRVRWYITSSTNGTSSTKTATPTTIPRASEIDSMSTVTTQDYPTIKWTPKSSAFKYKVKYLSADGTTYVQSGLISPNQTTQYSYNSLQIPNTFFDNVKSNYTQIATAILYTYQSDGTTLIGQNSTTFTVTLISNAKPHVWIENITDVGTTPSGWNVLVKGKSKIRYDVKYYFPSPVPASAIIISNTNGQNFSESATISTSTQTKQFTTSVLNTTGSNSISARVTDSRTRYTDATPQTYNVVAYSNPTISTAQVQRCDVNGNIDKNGNYCYISFNSSISSCSGYNTPYAEYKVKYRVHNTGSYNEIDIATNTNSIAKSGMLYTDGIYAADRGSGTKLQLTIDSTWDIQFYVEDAFTNLTNVQVLDTGFDLMNFNPSGKAMAIGKVSEAGANEEKFEVAVPTTFTEYIKDELVVEKIRSKNMFDKNNVIHNCRFGASGEEIYDNSGTSGTYYIEVEPSTTYAISHGIDWAQVVCLYDSSKTFIQRFNYGGGRTFTTTSATKYVRISVYDTNLDTFQLEKGSSSTTYYPYQNLNPLTPNGIFAGVSGSGTIYVDITTFTTLTLSQVIQVGNFFEISNGGIKCLRAGTIEVSGKIHIQSPASSNAVRWLEIHNGNTQIAVFPSAVTARTTLTSPPIISNVSANDIIYLKYDGVSGDRLRGNKEYTSLYVKYIN